MQVSCCFWRICVPFLDDVRFFDGGVLLVPTLVLPNTAALSDSGILMLLLWCAVNAGSFPPPTSTSGVDHVHTTGSGTTASGSKRRSATQTHNSGHWRNTDDCTFLPGIADAADTRSGQHHANCHQADGKQHVEANASLVHDSSEGKTNRCGTVEWCAATNNYRCVRC